MKKIFILVLTMFALAKVGSYGQSDNGLYGQTVSFLKLLTYGEHARDIGLKFSWRQMNGKWEPSGNGFVFLSEGLGVYDYMVDTDIEVPIGSLWAVDDNARLEDVGEYALAGEDTGLVRFVDNDSISNGKANTAAIVFIELHKPVDATDSVIPAKITYTIKDDNARENFGFAAFIDRKDGLLIFRFENRLAMEQTVYIDNTSYPASRFGVMTRTVMEPGVDDVTPSLNTIEMKGRVTLPPFSVSFYKFATGHSTIGEDEK